MKKLFYLLSALLVLGLTSCDSFNMHPAISAEGVSYSGSGLDHLRGMNPSRERDTNEVSKRFMLNLPRHPYVEKGHDSYVIASGVRVSHTWYTYYTGNIKLYQWKSGGVKHFFVVREAHWPNADGTGFCHTCWQGSNPSCGYYNVRNLYCTLNPTPAEIQEALNSVAPTEFRPELKDCPYEHIIK